MVEDIARIAFFDIVLLTNACKTYEMDFVRILLIDVCFL